MDDFYDPGDTRDQCEEIASELVSRSLTSKRNSSSYAQVRRVDWAEPHPCLQMAVDLVTSFLERNDDNPEGIAELVGSVHARLVELYYGASATVPGGMAQGLNAFDAACSAVHQHGLMANRWPDHTSLTASQLAQSLS